MRIEINTRDIADYRTFLAIRKLPTYQFRGSTADFPDEYASRIGIQADDVLDSGYSPFPFSDRALLDYQDAITRMAITRRKFCVFADCGLGKTLILLEYARHVAGILPDRRVLIVSPLMVVDQTLQEAATWYGDGLPIQQVPSSDVSRWLAGTGGGIGITNYEAFTQDVDRGNLGGLIIDESSMLKSHYGRWGAELIRLGRGVPYKLALSGTPAPNDRIEYANHAVLMDAFPTVNSFLARYFINRGQTDNRWELKPHAINAFYRDLSHWAIFLTNPATYGWHALHEKIPPIHVHIHDVPLTYEQRTISQRKSGDLFLNNLGGIASRTKLATLAKGYDESGRVPTHKIAYIQDLIAQWEATESTIVWCLYNEEQDIMREALPAAASISGDTPHEKRKQIISDFKAGAIRTIITKGKILGFGLNLQIATRQVFSALQDSYETFYQCVKRSNRYGSTRPLNVHIPVTELERPMIETVLSKARRVQTDAEEIERIFRNASCA